MDQNLLATQKDQKCSKTTRNDQTRLKNDQKMVKSNN